MMDRPDDGNWQLWDTRTDHVLPVFLKLSNVQDAHVPKDIIPPQAALIGIVRVQENR